nr:PREDICTED: uncharacterized protein LOC109039929 [Bemisia tabaci]
MEMTTRLEALLSTKEQLIFQLQCFESVVTETSVSSSSPNFEGIEARCNNLSHFMDQIARVAHDIKRINPDLFDQQELMQIEQRYYSNIGKAKTMLRSRPENADTDLLSMAAQQNAVTTVDLIKASKFKVPDLPKFEGRYSDWTAFKQMFDSLIHNNTAIPTILKFHHLKCALGAKPALLIKNLDFTEPNYEIALTALTERYEDKHLTIIRQVEILMNMSMTTVCKCKKSTKLTAKDLESMYNCVNQTIQTLRAMEVDTDSWDPIICHAVTSRFDESTITAWGNKMKPKTTPTKEQILAFLDKRRRVLESLESSKNKDSESSGLGFESKNERKKVEVKRKAPHQTIHGFVQHQKKISNIKKCIYCSGSHYISSCLNFRKLTLPDRYTIIKSENLCHSCMRQKHSNGEQCKGYPCKTCGKNHHIALHQDKEMSGHVGKESSSGARTSDI